MKKFILVLIALSVCALVCAAQVADDNLQVNLDLDESTAISFTFGEYTSASVDLNHNGFETTSVGDASVPVVTLNSENSYASSVWASARTNASTSFTMYLTYEDLTSESTNDSIELTVTVGSKKVNGTDNTNASASTDGKIITLSEGTATAGNRAISYQLNIAAKTSKENSIADATAADNYSANLTLTVDSIG